jgi:GNAT superfamily N-acetyltransferase
MDLSLDYPRAQPTAGVVMRRGEISDVRLLEQLDTVSPAEGRRRVEDGNYLNLVLEGPRLLHCSFTFTRGMPSIAAAFGEFPLPADTRCLEDGVTAPDSRGTGIGPQCITFIIDGLKAEGVRWVVVKVAVDNISSRRHIEKGGFEEMARLRHERWGLHSRSSLRPTDESAPHCLAVKLAPKLRPGRARGLSLATRKRAIGRRHGRQTR